MIRYSVIYNLCVNCSEQSKERYHPPKVYLEKCTTKVGRDQYPTNSGLTGGDLIMYIALVNKLPDPAKMETIRYMNTVKESSTSKQTLNSKIIGYCKSFDDMTSKSFNLSDVYRHCCSNRNVQPDRADRLSDRVIRHLAGRYGRFGTVIKTWKS